MYCGWNRESYCQSLLQQPTFSSLNSIATHTTFFFLLPRSFRSSTFWGYIMWSQQPLCVRQCFVCNYVHNMHLDVVIEELASWLQCPSIFCYLQYKKNYWLPPSIFTPHFTSPCDITYWSHKTNLCNFRMLILHSSTRNSHTHLKLGSYDQLLKYWLNISPIHQRIHISSFHVVASLV